MHVSVYWWQRNKIFKRVIYQKYGAEIVLKNTSYCGWPGVVDPLVPQHTGQVKWRVTHALTGSQQRNGLFQGHAHSIRPTCSTFGSQSSRKILSGNLVWIAFPKGSYVHGVLINLVFNLVPNQAPAWWISPASSPRSSWPRWSGPSPCSWSSGWGWRT